MGTKIIIKKGRTYTFPLKKLFHKACGAKSFGGVDGKVYLCTKIVDCGTSEEVLRLAISPGGGSDTIGAMACAIAACIYPIPEAIAARCDTLLTDDLREIKDRFLELL